MPITSIYLPNVERYINAYDIAKLFHKAGIFMASAIAIEKAGQYNRVYIKIDKWHENESAYNFIMKLQNPELETRFVYDNKDELWWAIHINKFIHKVKYPGKNNRMITSFVPYIFTLFEEEDLEEPEQDEDIEWAKQQIQSQLYRFRTYWEPQDLDACEILLGEPLRCENEEHYYKCLEQKYDWVDILLESKCAQKNISIFN